MTRDAVQGRPAKDIYWINEPPKTRKLPPRDILKKGEELSKEAKAAKTLSELWGSFPWGVPLSAERFTPIAICQIGGPGMLTVNC
jgi:hypothetical protein